LLKTTAHCGQAAPVAANPCKNLPHDPRFSANVRQAVVGDSSLSTNAHNVKIVTSGGTVTLRGPVKSTEEKAAIEAKAKQVAGVTRVDNLLEVEGNR
jgi:hyperosmotically inducible periplasmic protein